MKEQDYDTESLQEAISLGLEVVYADDHTLQLDIDSEADYLIFKDNLARLRDMGALHLRGDGYNDAVEEWRSKSGNRHIQIHLDEHYDLPVSERIQMQAILGSDRVREACNMRRVIEGIEKPIRLFRPPPGWKMPIPPIFDDINLEI